ncbi:albusnodin/ikarugamycin family macrolactam cyclase [Streptomyces uncialis]|uniref:albusnodin/ikarugamycin family macrolactam cyclase n=1 Tax=Streptomyces uncialis TaxID=1048205 RepID=UPI00381E1E47
MGWFGGAVGPPGATRAPVGARLLWRDCQVWTVGASVRASRTANGRRLAVFGPCAVVDAELNRLVESAGLDDLDAAATAWPGAYALILDDGKGTLTLWADPAGACPLYTAQVNGTAMWASSSMALASLLGGRPDIAWLAAHLMSPTAWVPGRSAWAGVEQVPPGCSWTTTTEGDSAIAPYWRSRAFTRSEAVDRLREDIAGGVRLRVDGRPASSDLSGGLDSSSLTAHAAQRGTVTGITYHPTGRDTGGDADHARTVAGAFPSIRHRFMPLGREHLPFTDLDALVLTDEPAPSTITIAQLFSQFVMLESEGVSVHLTGDGGDTLFMPPPVHLADLARSGRVLRLARDAQAWARLHRASPWPALAAAWATPGRLSGAPLPKPWLSTRTVDMAEAVTAPHILPVRGHADRYLLAEARYVGRTAATETQLAAAFGIEMHNPYTDARLVETVLAAPSMDRWSAHRYKPLLADAVKGLLPEEVVQRGAKGLFTVDHHHGLRANEARVLDLADGHLGDLGLVRPAVLRSLLRRAMLGVDIPWGLIEPVLGAELWLRISGTATRQVRWKETA